MWNPFSNKDKERADKLDAQLQKLLDREQARLDAEVLAQEEAKAREEEAKRAERLAAEAIERKHAEKNLATE